MRAWAAASGAWRSATAAVSDRSGLDDVYKLRYLRSFLLLRVLIGALGLALPFVVWLGSAFLPGGGWALRGSLSAYYYSGMREFFTGGLWAIGVFLVAYKVFEPTLENLLTTFSGAASVLVAFFPTNLPAGGSVVPTALQRGLGSGHVAAVHYSSAGVFILSLAVLSHLFGAREGNRPSHGSRHDPSFWKRFHNTCAAAIVAACAFVGVGQIPGVTLGGWLDNHSIWLGEVIAVVAFGASWLAKGAELTSLVDVAHHEEHRAEDRHHVGDQSAGQQP